MKVLERLLQYAFRWWSGRDGTADREAASASSGLEPDRHLSAITLSRFTGPNALDDPRDRVVRPALSVLFHLAVGPSADYYRPRFLAYERAGRAMTGWHWPALFAPAVWAFYRKLWWAGLLFALAPVCGAYAMAQIAPWLDDFTWLWLACATLLTLVLPSVSGAVLANALLYGRVRRRIRRAEARAGGASQAATRVGGSSPVSPFAAIVLGTLALGLLAGGVAPVLFDAYREHAVRVKVGKALAGLSPLKEQIEESWAAFRRWPRPAVALEIPSRAGAMLFDEVAVDPATGRVRFAVGAAVPELAGKAILLVPAVDHGERVRWYCVAIGIPDRHLPQICRKVAR